MKKSRFDFLGVKFSIAKQATAATMLLKELPISGYVCFPDASVVAMANRDPLLMDILNNSLFTFPDGKPSEIVAKLRGNNDVTTVSGFHLTKSLLKSDKSHFFYGADNDSLEKMLQLLNMEFPDANILGVKSPPYIGLSEIALSEEIKLDLLEIADLKPDIVWVGVSSPKQDYIMHYYHKMLPRSIMIGIGGVFLYLASPEMKSPEWVKNIGMRWLYRLIKEPKRLTSKYITTFRFFLENMGYFYQIIKNRKNSF